MATDVALAFNPADRFAPVLGVAAGAVAVAATLAGVHALGQAGFDSKVEGIGMLALGVESGLACAASCLPGQANLLANVTIPFALVHGGADLYTGIQTLRQGGDWREGWLEIGMGVGIIGAALFSPYAPGLQLMVAACLAGKMTAPPAPEVVGFD